MLVRAFCDLVSDACRFTQQAGRLDLCAQPTPALEVLTKIVAMQNNNYLLPASGVWLNYVVACAAQRECNEAHPSSAL